MSNMDHTATPWHIEVERNSTVFIDSADSRVAFVFPGFEHANADFIVRACNAYDQLVADNANLRQDLNDARTGWEQATEAVREAEVVREKLVAALKAMMSYETDEQLYAALAEARAALSTAEAA